MHREKNVFKEVDFGGPVYQSWFLFSRTWAAKLTFAGKMTHPRNEICENV